MFRFYSPIYLWFLLLIPLLAIVYIVYLYKRRRRMKAFGETELLRQLTPEVSKYRPHVKFTLMLLMVALAVVILARPQMGAKVSTDKTQGIETIIALDISNSMLAQDVTPSRLDKSKLMVENLLDRFSNDKVGLIVFAGDAFVQLPITNDFVSAKMFLDNIDPSLIGTQGTDIGQAIDLAMHSFNPKSKTGKAIVVITDGEDHEKKAEDIAKKAASAGMKVFILGIGTPSGAPIPMGNGEYLKDRSGNTVMTRLNEQMCQSVAAAGKGMYIHVDNTSLAESRLFSELRKLQKGELDSIVYSDFDEQFQAVALILLLLLIIESLLLEGQNPVMNKWHLFTRKK